MLTETIRQLKSADPAARRAAIAALAESRDPAALRPLAAVYRSDPDAGLRELALKAGQYIQQHRQQPPQHAEGAAFAAESLSERDRQLAQGYLSSATDFHIAGDKARAVENLGKALSMNPGLQKEPFVINLIMNVTGTSVAKAVPVLTHPDRRAAFINYLGGKQKLQRRQEHGKAAHTATWQNVAIDFAVYGLASIMTVLVTIIFTLSLLQTLFDDMDLYTTATAAENMDVLMDASIIALFIAAVISGLSQIIGLALQGLFVHLAATIVFGGDGVLAYLYRRLVPFQTFVTVIIAGVMLLLGLTGDIGAMAFVIGMGATVGVLVFWVMISRLIGEVYAFSAWSGCGAILIGGIIQTVVMYLGNFMLLSLVSALFGG